jgi:hypothetical protein
MQGNAEYAFPRGTVGTSIKGICCAKCRSRNDGATDIFLFAGVFGVSCLMFDVVVEELEQQTLNVKHQTSNTLLGSRSHAPAWG